MVEDDFLMCLVSDNGGQATMIHGWMKNNLWISQKWSLYVTRAFFLNLNLRYKFSQGRNIILSIINDKN